MSWIWLVKSHADHCELTGRALTSWGAPVSLYPMDVWRTHVVPRVWLALVTIRDFRERQTKYKKTLDYKVYKPLLLA
jgi:hypothetical protein